MLKKASPRAGKLVVQQTGPGGYSAFIPCPLPPNPNLEYDEEIKNLVERASRALGKLDGATYTLPNPDLFLYMYVRKEAILSSQIEGTQASLADLLEYEEARDESTSDDVKEVSNYVSAMHYGLERLETLPLSLRLIKEIHQILLQGTRGGHRAPGQFRNSQNWIGGTSLSNARFVPPPAQNVLPGMSDLENYIHDENDKTTALIKAGLVHAQFETIHPFLDGNGRVGRLLITFLLCREKVIEKPLLYLSLYFKQYRDEYYERLTAIRRDGDWEGWIKFYLTGIYEISNQALIAAKSIMDLQAEHRALVNAALGKASPTALRLLEILYQSPVISVPVAARKLQLSAPAARKAMKNLEGLNILQEISGKRRGKLYMYVSYMNIIREGTDY